MTSEPSLASPVSARVVEPERAGLRDRPRFDLILLAAVLGLVAIGVVMVYSSSAVFAAGKMGDGFFFAKRQLLFIVIGAGAAWGMLRLGYRRLEPLAVPILVICFLLVVATLLPGLGQRVNGARRWIHFPFFQLQPTEFAKVALCIYLARSVATKGGAAMSTFTIGLLPHFFVVGALGGVVLAQPDFGTLMVLLAVTGAVLLVAGVRLIYVGMAVLGLSPFVLWLVVSEGYRMRRITAFLDPFADRFGAGYQVAEAMMSVGSGGVTGLGLGRGPQKLGFLPEGHTDYILASVGEELGLLGLVLVLGLLAVVVWRGLRAARRASDAFGCFLAYGLTVLIGIETLLNAGMCMGMLPSKGLALPFLSYGGTSILKVMLAAGILLSISEGRGGYLESSGAQR